MVHTHFISRKNKLHSTVQPWRQQLQRQQQHPQAAAAVQNQMHCSQSQHSKPLHYANLKTMTTHCLYDTTPRFREAIKLMNGVSAKRFPLLLERIVTNLHNSEVCVGALLAYPTPRVSLTYTTPTHVCSTLPTSPIGSLQKRKKSNYKHCFLSLLPLSTR